jgi:DNA-binding NarL/FixJ family response regulator
MSGMPAVRVVVVDDHDILRVGVHALVDSIPGYEVVGEAGNAGAALEVIARAKPDVVLMDLNLPGMDGIVATREVLRRAPAARVIVFTAHKQTHDVVNAIQAGAVGYVLKADPPETLMRALDQAAQGARYVTPVLAGRVAAYKPTSQETVGALDLLSERERQVFQLAAACRTRREIARELRLALRTIDTLLGRINRKLGIRSRAERVKFAYGADLVPPTPAPAAAAS